MSKKTKTADHKPVANLDRWQAMQGLRSSNAAVPIPSRRRDGRGQGARSKVRGRVIAANMRGE